jgi:hypothetical protein
MAMRTTIEARCAHYGSQIVENKGRAGKGAERLESVARNAMGVLREDGLYAFYLFLRYRWGEGGDVVWEQIRELWAHDALGPLIERDGGRDEVIALTESLPDLLLAREVAERALVYALYGLRSERGS